MPGEVQNHVAHKRQRTTVGQHVVGQTNRRRRHVEIGQPSRAADRAVELSGPATCADGQRIRSADRAREPHTVVVAARGIRVERHSRPQHDSAGKRHRLSRCRLIIHLNRCAVEIDRRRRDIEVSQCPVGSRTDAATERCRARIRLHNHRAIGCRRVIRVDCPAEVDAVVRHTVRVDRHTRTKHHGTAPSQCVATLIVHSHVRIHVDRRRRDIQIGQSLRSTDSSAKRHIARASIDRQCPILCRRVVCVDRTAE